MHQIFVSGIGTDVGKSIISTLLCQTLENVTYLKPIQAGLENDTDSDLIRKFATNTKVLPEIYKLKAAMSPHAAAELEGIDIDLEKFVKPQIHGNFIVEGAGGIMVPLNMRGQSIMDLMTRWEMPVLIVVKNYLGSINHTMLTIEMLLKNSIEIFGLVFCGEANPQSEAYILKQYPEFKVAKIANFDLNDENAWKEQSKILKESLDL